MLCNQPRYRPADIGGLLLQNVNELIWIQMILMLNEFVRREALQIEFGQKFAREVPFVIAYYAIRPASDGCRQDVAIPGVILHGTHKVLVAFHKRVWERGLHLFYAVRDLNLGISEFPEHCLQLFEDLRGPSGSVECRLACQAEKRVR